MAEQDHNIDIEEQDQGHAYPFLAIQDIDGWLAFNGLRSADDEPSEPAAYGSFMSVLNRSETQRKYEESDRYQKSVHKKLFKDALEAEKEQQAINEKLLEAWEGEEMEIQTSGKSFRVPLAKIAAECDTIFTLASSRRYMKTILNNSSDEEEEEEKGSEDLEMVILSLDDYSASAVQEFIDLALYQKKISDIESHHVVDCCQIGHYLQCARILQGTVHILLQHVDSDNCLSLCQMADRLGLSDLFERSLFHMMKSLDQLENHDAYEDFSPELKQRIEGIRQVFTKNDDQSRKKLYFTSLQEYVAIFAENVQYHRERLEEAKAQNAGKGYSSYQQSKIEKQELRVLTLEAMLQEQKRLFGTSISSKSIIKKKRPLSQS